MAETKADDNGTSKPESQFTSDDNIDPAIDGVTALSDGDEVAERSPDGSVPGQFTKAFILDRLDLDANGKVPESFDDNPNIDGTRAFGVAAGVRFTGAIKRLSNKANPDAPGTRVLTYGGPAVPAGTLDEDGVPVRDYYDPDVVDAGEVDETVESNSAEAEAAE
jgi:hypothetical protein